MSSYYKTVIENLEANRTAKVEDIHLIQSNIQEAFHDVITNILGSSFILGENEDDLKLIPTSDYIDQCNYNYDSDLGKCWIHFYDRYLRQSFEIEKSSIEAITLHMKNTSKISVTVYAEIRDSDFDIITKGEASAVLEPLSKSSEQDYTPVTFTFNAHHLPVGQYYLVLRPIDISTTDLVINGDESVYDIKYDGTEKDYHELLAEHFCVRFDIDGTYPNGRLEASYDGTNYLQAYRLEDQLVDASELDELDEDDKDYDLYFEQTYSSGHTYLINPGSAVIFGQPVESFDTHIKINDPSPNGDRIDLVVLTAEGKLEVVYGNVGEGYPPSNNGLKIAYITSYKNGEKVPKIEQDDENNMTRTRDILERIRRLEKKATYQMENNAPTRIKYNCTVDPVMFKNGLNTEQDLSEGTYKLSLNSDENNDFITTKNGMTYIWSIINNNTQYTYKETTKTSAYCQIFDVDIPVKKPSQINEEMKYTAYLSTKKISTTKKDITLEKPIKNEKIKIVIKKGKTTKYTKTIQTNNKGVATFNNLWAAKLAAGKYTIESTVGDTVIKNTLVVHKSSYSIKSIGQKVKKITVKDSEQKTTTTSFSNNIITGDNGFSKNHVSVDTTKGVIQLSKVNEKNNTYITNELLSPNSKGTASTTGVKRTTHGYHIKSNKKDLTSEFPVMHFEFEHDTYIKSITPYIRDFKNIQTFGIVFFKNPYVTQIKNHKRETIQKKMNNDTNLPNVYKGEKKLTKFITNNDKQRIENFVTFDVNKTIEAGTYTLICWGKLKNSSKDGYIYTGEYKTNSNLKKYGIGQKSIGSSNLSLFKMKMNNLTDRSWNVKIVHKEDKYYEKGTITSVVKKTPKNIESCAIKKNVNIPNGCKLTLKVSNDGGSTWVDASTAKKVNFTGPNNSFRWKMILEGNQNNTPQLLYKQNKNYAIQFNLNTEKYSQDINTIYVPYEDYGCCYETPLFNANSITKLFVANNQITNTFTEWEFARIFMEDEDNSSKIDIGISYSDDATINVGTLKSGWKNKKIFFSQFFADLKLSDFSTTSVDYDNYDGNVEFDEHNYRFTMDSEYLKHDNSNVINTIPTHSTDDYFYGNINKDNISGIVNKSFVYEEEDFDKSYEYEGNEEEETDKYSGMHIKSGPYKKAIFIPNHLTGAGLTTADTKENPIFYNKEQEYEDNDIYSSKYIINGVSFIKPLNIDESKSTITLYIYPDMTYTKYQENDSSDTITDDTSTGSTNDTITDDTESGTENTTEIINRNNIFPAGTFSVVVALTIDGSLADDSSYGKSYVINEDLEIGKFNEVSIDLSEDIDAYAESGIHSIGITVNEDVNGEVNKNFIEGDSIGLGPIGTSYYNIRPYVSYTYTQKWERLQWKLLDNDCKVYNLCKKSNYAFFYPSYKGNNASDTDIITIDSSAKGIDKYGYKIEKTNIRDDESVEIKSFDRNNSTITIHTTTNNVDKDYITTSSNAVLFKIPENKTGKLFKIDTNLPFSIYDFIDIEYYVYNISKATNPIKRAYDNTASYDGRNYEYDGYISKGDILVHFYDDEDIKDKEPVETFALPSWGRVQQTANVEDKTVHAWFKKRSNISNIKSIVIERQNPSGLGIPELGLVIKNILLYNSGDMVALGPQMQMRIYPENQSNDVQIRKVGCIYRI